MCSFYRSGLFRPLRSLTYEGALVCVGVSLGQKTKVEKYLVDVSLVMKGASAGFLVFA